jgi:hypothetical protein
MCVLYPKAGAETTLLFDKKIHRITEFLDYFHRPES